MEALVIPEDLQDIEHFVLKVLLYRDFNGIRPAGKQLLYLGKPGER